MFVPIEVSPLRAVQRCPKLFEYRYIRNLERIHKTRPILLGLELHQVFDEEGEYGWDKALNNVDTRWAEADPNSRDMYTKVGRGETDPSSLPQDVRRIIRAYRQNYEQDDWNVLHRELLVKGKVDDQPFQGVIDKIVEAPSLGPGLSLVDHKSTGQIPDETIQRLDIQLPTYALAARQILDLDIKRVVFDYVLTKVPTIPLIVGLKDRPKKDSTYSDGKGPRLSGRKIVTDTWTWMDTFNKAQAAHGIQLDGYHRDLLAQAQADTPRFFRRVSIELTPHVGNTVKTEITATRSIAQPYVNADIFPRHVSITNCPTCDFKRLCMAEFDNHPDDISAALEDFIPNNYWERHN